MDNNAFIVEQLLAFHADSSLCFFETIKTDNVIKTMVAMANGHGGTILLGVDCRHHVVGVDDSANAVNKLEESISKSVLPRMPYTLSVVGYKGKQVIILSIWEGSSKPYLFNMKAYTMEDGNLREADADRLLMLFDDRTGHDESWERVRCYNAEMDALDMDRVKKVLADIQQRSADFRNLTHEEFLVKTGLVVSDVPTHAAILLFGKNPSQYLPQVRIRVSVYSGVDVRSLVEVRIFEGNLFDNIEHLTEYCSGLYGKTLRIDGMYRKEVPVLPMAAFREALLNAMVHRDYSSHRSFLNIVVNADNLQISNYGTLPEGVSVESLRTEHHSILRNPDIANICYLSNLIEMAGSGTLRIIEECRQYPGLCVEWKDENNILTFVLTGLKHKKLDTPEANKLRLSNVAVQKALDDIVAFVGTNPGCKLSDIRTVTGKSLASAKRYIQLLRENGIMEYVGSAKTGGYRLL